MVIKYRVHSGSARWTKCEFCDFVQFTNSRKFHKCVECGKTYSVLNNKNIVHV